jgi:hypothetical protein
MKVTGAVLLALPGRGLDVPRFQVDDDFHDDPAIVRAGTAAFGLYVRCGTYVAEHLLDGHVPTEIASQYGTPEWIKKLLGAGLWETEPGGRSFNMPRYFAHGNPTRERVLAEREMKQKRQQRWLEKTRNISSEQRRVSRRVDRPSHEASRDGLKDDALPPSLTGRKGAPARAARYGAGGAPRRPPWCGRCDENTRMTGVDGDSPGRCPSCHPLREAS